MNAAINNQYIVTKTLPTTDTSKAINQTEQFLASFRTFLTRQKNAEKAQKSSPRIRKMAIGKGHGGNAWKEKRLRAYYWSCELRLASWESSREAVVGARSEERVQKARRTSTLISRQLPKSSTRPVSLSAPFFCLIPPPLSLVFLLLSPSRRLPALPMQFRRKSWLQTYKRSAKYDPLKGCCEPCNDTFLYPPGELSCCANYSCGVPPANRFTGILCRPGW